MCVACILLWATGCNCARLPSKKRQQKQGQRGGPALVGKGQGESAAFFLAPSMSRTLKGKGKVPSKHTSSTVPPPQSTQLCDRSCSKKHTNFNQRATWCICAPLQKKKKRSRQKKKKGKVKLEPFSEPNCHRLLHVPLFPALVMETHSIARLQN